jgi:glycerol kinase
MQLIADLLGVSVVASGLEEVSALGAAYMAALGSKMVESLADLTDLPRDKIAFEPSESADRIQADYEIWQQMIHKHC